MKKPAVPDVDGRFFVGAVASHVKVMVLERHGARRAGVEHVGTPGG